MEIAVPLTKSILAQLLITAAAAAIDVGIQKKIHSPGTTTLIISNKKMNDIMKIAQAFEDSNLLLKGATETIKQKWGYLGTLLGTLASTLLGNMVAGKGIVRAGSGNKKGKGIEKAGSWNKKGKGIGRAGCGNEMDF